MADQTVSKSEDPVTERPLTSADVLDLATIIAAVQRDRLVRRVIDGQVFAGNARHLVASPTGVCTPGHVDDVRACYLRVTLLGSGVDAFWPVMEVVEALRNGEATFRR